MASNNLEIFDGNEIDDKWKVGDYKSVLRLVESGSRFPREFKMEILDEEDEDQLNLKTFYFRQLICDNNLSEIKRVTLNKGPQKYFYYRHSNGESHSAAYTALWRDNFKIYDYFKSIGHDYGENELNVQIFYEDEDEIEKAVLREIQREYLRGSGSSHVEFLSSRVQWPETVMEHDFTVLKDLLFKELNGDERNGIPIILKVVATANDLNIILVRDSDATSQCLANGVGVTFAKEQKIYIDAKKWMENKEEREIFGTAAHELTHLAMELVFENGSKPYFKSNRKMKAKFQEWKADIRKMDKKKLLKSLDTPLDKPLGTLLEAFCYEEDKVDGELIARIPDILAQYGIDERKWLERQVDETQDYIKFKTHVLELFEFYIKQVIPECKKFINEDCRYRNIKYRIRQFNETKGEIERIRKNRLAFKDITELKNILNNGDKNIFVLTTESTSLSLVRVLQAFKKDWVKSCDNFLVLKLENCAKIVDLMKRLFYSIPCDILIIESSCIPENWQLIETILKFNTLNKKIVFVTKENNSEIFERILKKLELGDEFVKGTDHDFSLWDLQDNPRRKILKKKIKLQGRKIALRDLVNGNEDLQRYVNSKMIERLLEGKEFEIGSKVFGTSSLEGAYADIFQKIDKFPLINELENKKNFFIIERMVDQQEFIDQNFGTNFIQFTEKINRSTDSSSDFTWKRKILTGKRIFLSEDEIEEDDFKEFCDHNSERKIYLIKRELNKSEFVLNKMYNPEFNFERSFKKFEKIIIKRTLEKDAREFDNFIIIKVDYIDKLRWSATNVSWLDSESAKDKFKNMIRSRENVHLLQEKNDGFEWIRSHNSLSNLKDLIDEELTSVKFIEERNLFKEIINEKVVIIADDHGMGKTTTLTKLTENKSLNTGHWVITINLKDKFNAISKIREKEIKEIKDIITFLSYIDPKLNNYVSENLLQAALDTDKIFGKELLLCFHGYDELLNDIDRNRVMAILKFLKDHTKCKIWITTGLSCKEYLENELSTFSLTFRPIVNSQKADFIENFMKHRLKLSLPTKKYEEVFEEKLKFRLKTYTKAFIEKARTIFKKDVERFIGIPLHLTFLLKYLVKPFRDWIEKTEENPNFSHLGNNVLEVLEKILDGKYEIYLKKKNIFEKEPNNFMKETFGKFHEEVAELIRNTKLKENPTTHREILKNTSKYKSLFSLLGVIKFEDENPKFVDLIFGDYFFAKSLLRNLADQRNRSSIKRLAFVEESPSRKQISFARELSYFFVKEILVKSEYETIQSFVNLILGDEKSRKLLGNHEEEFRLVFKYLLEMEKETDTDTAFSVAIKEKYNHLLKFLFSFQFPKEECYRILGFGSCDGSLLHSAIQFENKSAFDQMIQIASKHADCLIELLSKANQNGETILHFVIGKNKKEFWNQISEVVNKFNQEQQCKLFTIVSKRDGTILHLALRRKNKDYLKGIIEIASKFTPDQKYELLSTPSKAGVNAFHLAVRDENNGYLERFINITSEFTLDQKYTLLSTPSKIGVNALQLAIRQKNDNYFEGIIKIVSELTRDQKFNLLRTPNKEGEVAIGLARKQGYELAVQRINALELELNS